MGSTRYSATKTAPIAPPVGQTPGWNEVGRGESPTRQRATPNRWKAIAATLLTAAGSILLLGVLLLVMGAPPGYAVVTTVIGLLVLALLSGDVIQDISARYVTQKSHPDDARSRERAEVTAAEYWRHPKTIDGLSPSDFEHYVAYIYRAQGWSVSVTRQSNDGGIDLWMERDGKRAIVQCKHYPKRSVGRPELQRFCGAMRPEKCSFRIFVTSGRFSEPARRFAAEEGIELVDRRGLFLLALRSFPISTVGGMIRSS